MILTFIFNLIILISELLVFIKLKNKKNIFKYYTYLYNFISLIISIITCIYIIYLYFDGIELFFIRGLRYIVCCGLITTMCVYILFISSDKSNCLSSNDFIDGFNYNYFEEDESFNIFINIDKYTVNKRIKEILVKNKILKKEL